jgi:hypothetical protein
VAPKSGFGGACGFFRGGQPRILGIRFVVPSKPGFDQIKVNPGFANEYVCDGSAVPILFMLDDTHFLPEHQPGHVLLRPGSEVLVGFGSIDPGKPDPNGGAAVENRDGVPVGDADALAGEFGAEAGNGEKNGEGDGGGGPDHGVSPFVPNGNLT